jgi:EAL domain-containing protein (putative c-di-GMP-specific phosphodiesterase class I)/CheY-like chemotaxis protein
MSRVLVVEDDDLVRESFRRALTLLGYEVVLAEHGRTGLQRFREGSFDTVLTDLVMPDMDGMTFLRELRRFDLDVPVIIVTGTPTLETAVKAVEYGAFRYITKPPPKGALAEALARAVQFHALARLRRRALSLVAQAGHALGDRASLEARFENALASARMAFQPIVSLRERRLIGYEALLRTEEPTLARPDHFVDAAARLGRLHELGRIARARTAAVACQIPDGVRLFVNIHANDIHDEELARKDAPLSSFAKRITLELTERAQLSDDGELRDRLSELRALGYRMAVDDLGAGYAGLASLSLIDPEVVKLDMSLVRNVDASPAKQEVIRSMARLCGELRMDLVVEGVETPAERDTLAGLGCDAMQGFLFARPAFELQTPPV